MSNIRQYRLNLQGIKVDLKSTRPEKKYPRDFVAILYTGSVGGTLVTIFCATILVLAFQTTALLHFKLSWIAIFYLLISLRLLDTLYWNKKLKHTDYDPGPPKVRFLVGAVFAAVMWTIYTIVIYPSAEVVELATTIIALSALSGGAATVLSGHKKLSVFYCLALLLPLSLMMSMSADQNHNVLGYLGLAFTVVLALASMRAADFTATSIELKNRNTELVDELAGKNMQISQVNLALEEKVQSRTQEIFALSNIDPLTGLYNRTAFSSSLGEILENCKQQERNLALLFIDLDGFKSVNDTLGHAIGDKVLIAVAQRLVVFANGPQHICRWGGDEFIIVIEGFTANEAVDFGRDLIKSLSQRIKVELSKISISATIGVAMYPEHGVNESELISLADTAMYIQKEASKSDVCVFSQKMRQSQSRERELKEGLALALQNKEFHLVYQPVIDNKTHEVSFCEVLLRWTLNGHLVPPQEFIPVAEQYGFIQEIGEWVLMTACAEIKQWIFDESVDLSVNVSVAQFIRPDFLGIVENALSASGVPGEKLHLEITESIFAGDMDTMLANVKAIQNLGVKVSVDDFGTGFSSLSQLQKLSADIVKIDQSFVATMDTGGQAIIQATQYMANEFGYSVVAEGVETKEQADELTKIGINCSQGFYFSHPMTIAELPNWYQNFKQKY